jgi:hypothetical protein
MVLYRLDHAWLMASKPNVQRIRKAIRVNWAARDNCFSATIGAVSLHLRHGLNNRGRVTKTAVARTAGRLPWMNKLGKLPKSQEKLHRLVEDRNGFACRRVKRLAHKSLTEGRPLKAWQLQRGAGIRPEMKTAPKITEVFDQAVLRLALAEGRI